MTRAAIAVFVLASSCSPSKSPAPQRFHPSCPAGAKLVWHDKPVIYAQCTSAPDTAYGYDVSYGASYGYLIDCYPAPTNVGGFLISAATLTRRLDGTREEIEPQVDDHRCVDLPLRPLWDELVARVASP